MGEPKNNYIMGRIDKTEDNAYSDNQSIRYPFYCIHGNHDNRVGVDCISGLDILETAGLINYIGKHEECIKHNVETGNDEIVLTPLLFEKGETKLSLYGIGYLPPDKMQKQMVSQGMKFLDPSDEYFKIIMVHQDRVIHGNTKTMFAEEFLENQFDFVIYGHEHQCIVNTGENIKSIQTGSPQPLSICEFEKAEKHISLMNVEGKNNIIDAITLRNIRELFY